MKHTPGPWRVGTRIYSGMIIAADGRPVVNGDGCSPMEMPTEEIRANSNLIAAAPRLLAAANRMLIVTLADEVEAASNELIAAINEAEGFVDDSETDHTDDICPCGDVDCSRPFGHA